MKIVTKHEFWISKKNVGTRIHQTLNPCRHWSVNLLYELVIKKKLIDPGQMIKLDPWKIYLSYRKKLYGNMRSLTIIDIRTILTRKLELPYLLIRNTLRILNNSQQCLPNMPNSTFLRMKTQKDIFRHIKRCFFLHYYTIMKINVKEME